MLLTFWDCITFYKMNPGLCQPQELLIYIHICVCVCVFKYIQGSLEGGMVSNSLKVIYIHIFQNKKLWTLQRKNTGSFYFSTYILSFHVLATAAPHNTKIQEHLVDPQCKVVPNLKFLLHASLIFVSFPLTSIKCLFQ